MKANMKAIKEFSRDTHGVSPVIATLMLVLVAAGAAVGLGAWMGAFQESSTQNVAAPEDAQILTIGGSSTVYEFSLAAINGGDGFVGFEEFMAQKGTPVEVELEKGGSGAGRKAVGLCLIDIGSSSSPVKDSDFDAYPDCNGDGQKDFGKQLQVHKVATDGVVFAMDPSNAHCDDPATATVTEVPALTEAEAFDLYAKNGDFYGTSTATPNDALGTNTTITWDDIPNSSGTDVCRFGADATTVEIFDRKDPGGTSEIASEKLFGQDAKQLESFGVTLNDAHQGDGNQGVWDLVEGNGDAIFFTSFGYANTVGATVAHFGTTNPIAPTSDNIADETYDATRPILYITAGEPSPVAQLYLDFVLNPHRNQQIAEAADFEHIY